MVKNLLMIISYLLFSIKSDGQGSTTSVGDLPNIISPTPEVSSILRSNFLSATPSTGAVNINIPLHSLKIGDFSLPVSLNYNSTGIKVDDIASMVGLGWTLNHGGVVSRTVMDIPDEVRDPSDNNTYSHDFSNQNYALLDYLDKADADKQSDIFSFSFGGNNGRFILDQNLNPKPLSQYNFKINIINGAFMEGFKIVTDDGTEYYFQNSETSLSRNLLGTNCKTWDNEYFDEVKTSWYLSKIILPSRQREINFTYIAGTTIFRTGLSESISLNIATEQYICSNGQGPSGGACNVWQTRFSSCSREQIVQSQFLTKIQTSDGDKIEFYYDPLERQDLSGGLRLASFKITNFQNEVIKQGVFNGSYQNAVNGTTSSPESKRLFLESLNIKDSKNSVNNQLVYVFQYNNYSALSKRLSYAQDIWGFYNGKTNNTCLIPKLAPDDLNYNRFNNGTGYGAVVFGDRSIDENYTMYGLLTQINYPTGGYDVITYTPNKTGNNILSGGASVHKITSYSELNKIAQEKEFVYRYYSNNNLSTFLLTTPLFSEVRTVKSDGYTCEGVPFSIHCVGPSCTKATSYSSFLYPTTTFGSQHVYHRSVLEYTKGNNTDNGFVEHKYLFYMDGGLVPQSIMGVNILSTAFNIVPDILVGENETLIYRKNGNSYQIIQSTTKEYENRNQSYSYNHFVRKNYQSICTGRPNTPTISEIEAYDVVEGRIYFNTPLLKKITEKSYGGNGVVLETITNVEYNSQLYSYPTTTKIIDSKGFEIKTERLYPPDFPSLSFMNNRNIINKVMEEKVYRNNALQTTKTQTFADWFSNGNLIAPQTSELRIANSTQTQKIIFHSYDVKGNLLEVSKESDMHSCYLWDYKNGYPIAKAVNAIYSDIAYTSFESDGKGTWNFSGSPLLDASAPTGKKAYNLSFGNISRSINSSKRYIICFWAKAQPTVSNSAFVRTGRNRNGFTYYEFKTNSGVSSVSISGSTLIDELRLYPENAEMTTYTYEPLIGLTSQCDANNRIIYYSYDNFNRLFIVKDQDNRILNKYCYNYQGQTENCTLVGNDALSQSFTKSICLFGQTGSSVSYSVPANIYYAFSKAAANALAQEELTTNGQIYANYNGTCTSTCNSTNCNGEGYACIYGTCEQGYKIYTGTYTSNGTTYCVYHYEFSDGSWSGDYYEPSGGMGCIIQ